VNSLVKLGTAAFLSLSAISLAAQPASAYRVFVSNEKENTITVIDSEKLEVVHTIKTGNRPRGIILANEGKWVIVCTSDDNRMQVYDSKTYEWVKDLPSGPDPELPILHTSGNPLYVSNEDDNLVTVVDIFKGTIITDIPVGVEPEGMGMSPDGKILVNTSETTNMAHFITTDGFKNVDNVLVDNRPRVAEYKSDGSEVWVSAEIGGTTILPDDRWRQRMSGDPVPQHHRLTLVGDPHRGQVRRRGFRPRQHFGDRDGLGHPDLVRIVLHPAGLGKILGKLALGTGDDVAAAIEEY